MISKDSRSARIQSFRNNSAMPCKMVGGVAAGFANGSAAREFKWNTDNGTTLRMLVDNNGRVVSMQENKRTEYVDSNDSGTSQSNGTTNKTSSTSDITVVTGVVYDVNSHKLIAKMGKLIVKNGVISVVDAGRMDVFTATPHSEAW